MWAPNARRVRVRGDWSFWSTAEGEATELAPQGSSGIWWGIEPRAREGHRYKYEITGADGRVTERADPSDTAAELPPGTGIGPDPLAATSGAMVTGVGATGPTATTADCRSTRCTSARGVATRTAGPTPQRELAEPLADHVAGLGFTHLELMPVASHPFGGSWGYQVSGYYAPDARLGSPDDLRHLIDVCHDRGLGVIVDWVPAHFPRDEFALARFDGTALYEHADPRRGEHPDWGTLVFNHGRNEVRNFLVANALYWLEEFHVDGLRVDAVASMLYLDYSRRAGEWVPNEHGGREDLEAVAFVRELNGVVAEEHPGAVVIAEESTSWPGVTAPSEWGGLGFSRKWNLGWMHDTLSYFQHDPVHRRFHHGELTFPSVYAAHERWILPLSHDEVVHGKGSLIGKMPGDDWQRFANLRCLLAWQWCSPGGQLLFMGAEVAQEREWSHDREVDWWLLADQRHAGIAALVGALNAAQRDRPALWAGNDDVDHTFWWLDPDDGAHSVVAFCRRAPGDGRTDTAAVVANLTPVPRHGYRLGVPFPEPWKVVLDTDNAAFGGSGHELVPGGGGPLEPDPSTPVAGPAAVVAAHAPTAVGRDRAPA